MFIKRFRIETPEQLRAVSEFSAYGRMSCLNRATVWSAVRNHKGATPWDNSFSVEFSAERFGSRRALICQDDSMLAEVNYNKALAYCRESLQLIEEVAG